MTLGDVAASTKMCTTSKIRRSITQAQRLSFVLKARRLIRALCASRFIGIKGHYQIEMNVPP